MFYKSPVMETIKGDPIREFEGDSIPYLILLIAFRLFDSRKYINRRRLRKPIKKNVASKFISWCILKTIL